MIKILFAASVYDYANPNLGKSYEYYSFYDSLLHLKNVEVKIFNWVKILNKYGKKKMNEMLYARAKREKPDLILFSIFRKEFDKSIVKKITDDGRTITFNMFLNDLWQFDNYSIHWAPCFTWVSTDEDSFVSRYRKIGCKKVIVGHWGFNQHLYKKLNLSYKFDMSFIGQAHGRRRGVVRGIRNKGIKISAFGRGFGPGKISFNKMIEVYNQSKINLNLSEHSKKYEFFRFLPSIMQPVGVDVNAFQLKARIFEIVGCGGFLLTTYGERLKEYFILEKEIETYSSFEELIEKGKYYLKNDSEREKIAKAGYKRAIKDHTYEKRFREIFKTIGL